MERGMQESLEEKLRTIRWWLGVPVDHQDDTKLWQQFRAAPDTLGDRAWVAHDLGRIVERETRAHPGIERDPRHPRESGLERCAMIPYRLLARLTPLPCDLCRRPTS